MPQSSQPTKRERRDAAREERLRREQAADAAAGRKRRLTILGGLVAAAAVIVVVAVLVSSGGGGKNASSGGELTGTADTQALFAGIPQSGITVGDPKAPVTIVEFADPQCPFCRDYTLNEMPAIVKKYVKAGKAKMELRMLTFIGPDSVTAGRALLAAGQQDKLWNSTDLLYRNQGEENTGYIDDAFLRKVLTGAGADADKALNAAGGSAVTQELGAATTLASRYNVSATPTILVGPSGGDLKADAEQTPTAAGIGKLVDAALAQGT